jgi:hypothetical protein
MIKTLIDQSGKTRYAICKETGILRIQLDKWYHGTVEPNLSVLKMLRYISKTDEEFIKNVDLLIKEKDA